MDGEITPSRVAELLEDGAPVRVVDIRSREEFARGHIPGSESIPFGRLPGEVERLSGADHVVTVCPHGAASVGAARIISGFEGLAEDASVQSMAGGLAAWSGEIVSDVPGDDEQASGDADAPF